VNPKTQNTMWIT